MNGRRLLIYSHDSFGLGHLRRCRAIAHDLVDRFRGLSVLILSGSPIIGSFDFKARVDFVRVPGVIKLRSGDYTSLNLHIDVEQTLAMRRSIISHTAELFAPDIFLVDKEPLGLRGEVGPTLVALRNIGTRCVLGLRDVMDEPTALAEEWDRKNVYPALRNLYDDIWVYGLPEIFDPLSEIPEMSGLRDKVSFTGYLRRSVPDKQVEDTEIEAPDRPFILVTAGGGGDGAEMIDWIIRAYEADRSIPWPALIVFGPFMNLEDRIAFQERVNRVEKLSALTFDAHIEQLVTQAVAIVAMGGYNTFCEILSFGKPALIVPRTVPRQEQSLRAKRAEKIGLLTVLENDGIRGTSAMIEAIKSLPHKQPPSRERLDGMLQGLNRIAELAAPYLGDESPSELTRDTA